MGGICYVFPLVPLPQKYHRYGQRESQLTCPCPFSIWQGKQPWGLSSLFSNWPFIISFLKETEKGRRSRARPSNAEDGLELGVGGRQYSTMLSDVSAGKMNENGEWMHKGKSTAGNWPAKKKEREDVYILKHTVACKTIHVPWTFSYFLTWQPQC